MALAGWFSLAKHHLVHQRVVGPGPTRSGHKPRLRVQSLEGVCVGDNWSVFLTLMSLPLSLFLSLYNQ